jgi:hypothetical protein
MKKITFISAFVLALISSAASAQTITAIDPAGAGGFELGETFEENGWGVQNANYGSRKWQIGTGQVGYTAQRAAFIGSSATTVGTSAGSRTVHLYKAVTIPTNATNVQLSFKYKQEVVFINAETGPNDYLYLSLLDEAPATGTTPTASQFGEKYPSTSAGLASYTEINVPVATEDIATGTQKYLVFTFRSNNLSDPNTIGWGGLDDVELTYTLPCNVSAPSAQAQNFCGTATTSELSAQGTGVIWYDVAENGTPLAEDATLATGTYYAASVEGTCESNRIPVAVTVTVADAPTGDATQTVTADTAPDATLQDLTVTATGTVTWYASAENAASGEGALDPFTQLENNTTYYATQTIGECESSSFAVTVTVVLDTEKFAIAGLSYNNPVNDVLNISAKQQLNDITVNNLLGQKVFSTIINNTQATVNTSVLTKGTYLLTITAANGSTTVKIIK